VSNVCRLPIIVVGEAMEEGNGENEIRTRRMRILDRAELIWNEIERWCNGKLNPIWKKMLFLIHWNRSSIGENYVENSPVTPTGTESNNLNSVLPPNIDVVTPTSTFSASNCNDNLSTEIPPSQTSEINNTKLSKKSFRKKEEKQNQIDLYRKKWEQERYDELKNLESEIDEYKMQRALLLKLKRSNQTKSTQIPPLEFNVDRNSKKIEQESVKSNNSNNSNDISNPSNDHSK